MQYRPEIDGLRALAVLSVIAYHVSPSLLPGGFIGVDIFFVISGYLISRIVIYEKRGSKKFSYANFYTRRIKRILPPLWAVLFFTALVAFFLFNHKNFSSYAWSAAAASLFSANHYFALNFNYFNSPEDSTLLLHLWSLSVEEQFYIIWPAVLLFVLRVSITDAKKISILTAFAVLSFLGAHLMAGTGRFENQAFYFLPPRAGELMVGCILAIYQFSNVRQIRHRYLGALGIALMLLPLFLYSDQTHFPGLSALVPCLGVALTVSQFDNSSIIYKKVLGNSLAVYFGKISYPLYLWHWPLLALPRYLFGEPSTQVLLAMVLLSVLMAHLSWVFLETPIRESKMSFYSSSLRLYLVPLTLLIILFITKPLINNTGIEYQTSSYTEKYSPFCFRHGQSKRCQFGSVPSDQKAILFGDSHAGHYTPYWDSLGKRLNIRVDAYSAQTCYPLLTIDEVNPSLDPSIKDKVNCIPHLQYLSQITTEYPIVILAAGWNIYTQGPRTPRSFDFINQFDSQLAHLTQLKKKVIIMAQSPWYQGKSIESYQHRHGIPYRALREMILDINDQTEFTSKPSVNINNRKIEEIAKRYENVLVVNPHYFAQRQEPLSPIFLGEMLYANSDHLSPSGSKKLADNISDRKLKELFTFLRR